MDFLQNLIHYSLHFLAPGIIAFAFFRENWKKAWLIMLATMLVDLDHVFACSQMFPDEGGFIWPSLSHLWGCKEIFVPSRCSIGFHPLHSYFAIIVYLLMFFFKKIRILAIGLLFHMLTDLLDCMWI